MIPKLIHVQVSKLSSMSMGKMIPVLIDIFRKDTNRRIKGSPKYMNFSDANPNSLEDKSRQRVCFEKFIYF